MNWLRRIRETLGCHAPTTPLHYEEVTRDGRRILEARAFCISCNKEIWKDRGEGWQLVNKPEKA